eukprot:Em0001g3566a
MRGEKLVKANELLVKALTANLLPPALMDSAEIQEIASVVKDLVNVEFMLENRLDSISTDQGANFIAAVQLLIEEGASEEQVRCACHKLQLSIKNSLEEKSTPSAYALVCLFRTITTTINNSPLLLDALKKRQHSPEQLIIDSDKSGDEECSDNEEEIDPTNVLSGRKHGLKLIKDAVPFGEATEAMQERWRALDVSFGKRRTEMAASFERETAEKANEERPMRQQRKDNLGSRMRRALAALQRQKQFLVFQKADKGSVIVVEKGEDYIRNEREHLAVPQVYQRLHRDGRELAQAIKQAVYLRLRRLHNAGRLTEEEYKYCIPPPKVPVLADAVEVLPGKDQKQHSTPQQHPTFLQEQVHDQVYDDDVPDDDSQQMQDSQYDDDDSQYDDDVYDDVQDQGQDDDDVQDQGQDSQYDDDDEACTKEMAAAIERMKELKIYDSTRKVQLKWIMII